MVRWHMQVSLVWRDGQGRKMFTNFPGNGVVQPKLRFIVSSIVIISMDIKGKLEIPEAEVQPDSGESTRFY